MKMSKRNVLGRGLDALIPDVQVGEDGSASYFQCDVDLIHPNPFQPRMRFPDEELEELAESIAEQGVIQPLIVRRQGERFELVAGERRLRAAKMAGLSQVPVLVQDIPDDKMLETILVENIQREDLNPMEEAEAYQSLLSQLQLTQEEVARRVGKKRSTVANFLRLRQLPEPIKESLREGALSMGHARALLGAESPGLQMKAWHMVISKGLSVRATEVLVNRLKKSPPDPAPESRESSETIYLRSLAEDLARRLGTKVQIARSGKRGKVEIEFYSDEDLHRLVQALKAA